MDRGTRRARTERVVKRRWNEWVSFIHEAPRRPGRAKKLSHFDCGRTKCQVCSQETRRPEPRREVVEW